MISLASLVMEYARCLSVVPLICETPETFSRSSWNALRRFHTVFQSDT